MADQWLLRRHAIHRKTHTDWLDLMAVVSFFLAYPLAEFNERVGHVLCIQGNTLLVNLFSGQKSVVCYAQASKDGNISCRWQLVSKPHVMSVSCYPPEVFGLASVSPIGL